LWNYEIEMGSVEKNFGWIRSDSKDAIHFELKEFNKAIYLINQRGEAIEVSEKGGLEIMALGHIGHFAWLKARKLNQEGKGG